MRLIGIAGLLGWGQVRERLWRVPMCRRVFSVEFVGWRRAFSFSSIVLVGGQDRVVRGDWRSAGAR